MEESKENVASSIARAFATYSLVPYLGILFCPGAVVMGSVGLAVSYRMDRADGRNRSYISIVTGILVLVVQLMLWWILYKVPGWAKGSNI